MNSFLGRGWTFPPRFDTKALKTIMVEDEQDIRESLRLLLSTRPGERIMRPEYGCDLHSQVFKSINSATISRIKDLISVAILYFEPRIDLEDIMIDTRKFSEGYLKLHLVYTIRTINVRSNMVYPFYFIEGTDIKEF